MNNLKFKGFIEAQRVIMDYSKDDKNLFNNSERFDTLILKNIFFVSPSYIFTHVSQIFFYATMSASVKKIKKVHACVLVLFLII